MRIAYIAAGAAGMYCGTCLHDNTLATALIKKGHDVALIPTYTPIRTDEKNVSLDRIFYGGINVYLQQKSAIFRHTPNFIDRLLDNPKLLNLLSRFSSSTDARDLGELTISILKGEHGKQKKELQKLIDRLKTDYKPEIVQLTNSMFVGMSAEIKRQLDVPAICAFQGEDIFLDGLIEPYRSEAMEILRSRSADVDGFIAPCEYYADFMSEYANAPRNKIHVVPLGLNLDGHGEIQRSFDFSVRPFEIGYLARICPEKGLHILIKAFHQLTQRLDPDKIRLKVAGYLGGRDQAYFDQILDQLKNWGIADLFEYRGEVDRREKIDFLNSIDVLSVPTVYRESKGLFVLESLANGTPVVLPDHGSFPELIEATNGGILVEALSPNAIANGINKLIDNPDLLNNFSQNGKRSVHDQFSADRTADATIAVYQRYVC